MDLADIEPHRRNMGKLRSSMLEVNVEDDNSAG
jgi:hypothetical protein